MSTNIAAFWTAYKTTVVTALDTAFTAAEWTAL
jgi:hypothetical protein